MRKGWLRALLAALLLAAVPASQGQEVKADKSKLTLTLKNGQTISGVEKGRDADWVTLDVGNGEMRVRLSEVSTELKQKPVKGVEGEVEKEMRRIVIYQGPYRSVQYVPGSSDPSDEYAARERARVENEAIVAADLSELKRQYVRGELLLDAERRPVQARLYGTSIESTNSSSLAYGYGPGGYGYGYWGGYGYGGYGYYNGLQGSTTSVSYSLANGVGDEGPIKREIARVLAGQAAPYGGSAATGVSGSPQPMRVIGAEGERPR